jgi:hypothetical protein
MADGQALADLGISPTELMKGLQMTPERYFDAVSRAAVLEKKAGDRRGPGSPGVKQIPEADLGRLRSQLQGMLAVNAAAVIRSGVLPVLGDDLQEEDAAIILLTLPPTDDPTELAWFLDSPNSARQLLACRLIRPVPVLVELRPLVAKVSGYGPLSAARSSSQRLSVDRRAAGASHPATGQHQLDKKSSALACVGPVARNSF